MNVVDYKRRLYNYLTEKNLSIKKDCKNDCKRKFKILFAYFINVLYDSSLSYERNLNIFSFKYPIPLAYVVSILELYPSVT